MKPPLPVPILQDLRCGHCRKFVTCGPVYVTPDSSVLCGRCVLFAKPMYRNIVFEAVASMFRYPCDYWPKHCNEHLLWNDALIHEKKCVYQSSCKVFFSKPGTFFSSDRKLPKNTDIYLEVVPEQVLQELHCVVCENYLSNSPVYLLPDGKNICHRCSHSNGVYKDAVRNLSYETIAKSLIFPCTYRFRGCAIRSKFGRDLWGHETECPYGQIQQKLTKTPQKTNSKKGKERGVIQTHSGHVWGTITPHSALFSPPNSSNSDGKIVTQELEEMMKKKHQDEVKGFDAQSMDSVWSKASTFDSLGDIYSMSKDNISRSTVDNISRGTIDNLSRDNVSRSTVDNISRDNISRSTIDNLSRTSIRTHYSNDPNQEMHHRPSTPRQFDNIPGVYPHEVAPQPTPAGYNRLPFNGYYQENVTRYSHLYHYPPIYFDNSQLSHSASFNYPPQTNPPQVAPKRVESFRVGNQNLIDELRERQKKQKESKDEQELVQKHDDCN